MNRSAIPTLVGVFTSLIAIWALHQFIMVDECLDQGGSFQYSSGKCLLESGLVHESSLATMALVLYFVVGFTVSLLVATIIRKIFNIPR
jgi:hypothetical protein